MKSRRSNTANVSQSGGARTVGLLKMRTLPDLSECSPDSLLEQLKYFSENVSAENLEMITTIASRLYGKLTTQDRVCKEKILEKLRRGKRDLYPLFLSLIQMSSNLKSMANVLGLLYESLNSKNVVHKNLALKLMVDLDATSILITSLIHNEMSYVSEYLNHLVWILGQLSWRDPRFLVKCRKVSGGCGTARAFHRLLKLRQVQHSCLFLPALHCLKTITKSPYFINSLIRDDFSSTLEGLLTSIGSAISVKLKLLLTVTVNLTKNNTFIKRMIKQGILSHLLLMFDRWQKFNTSRKFKLCHLILSILQRVVTVSKPARSLIACEVLHRFCLSLPEDSIHYTTTSKVFAILNIVSGTKILPLANMQSPVSFQLPLIDDGSLLSDGDDNDSDSDQDLDEQHNVDEGCEGDDTLLLDEMESESGEEEESEDETPLTCRSMDERNKHSRHPTTASGKRTETLLEPGGNTSSRSLDETRLKSSRNNAKNSESGNESNTRPSRRTKHIRQTPIEDKDMLKLTLEGTLSGNKKVMFENTPNVQIGEINLGVNRNSESAVEEDDQLLMYAPLFQEFAPLIPNTKENVSSQTLPFYPQTSQWGDTSDTITKSGRRTLRSLDVSNYVSSPDNCYETNPRLCSISTAALGKKSTTSLRVLQGIKPGTKPDRVYQLIANRIHSVGLRVKLAYPDLYLATLGEIQTTPEPLHEENRKNIKNKMLSIMERLQHPEKALHNVIYDYDALYETFQKTTPTNSSTSEVGNLSNCDISRLGVRENGNSKVLRFESRFESGNLRKAIQVGPYEYDLILMPDVNSTHHHQWFYFEVSNMESQAVYTLNIINQEKSHSQYQQGMKPLLFSVKEAACGRGAWLRTGSDVCYYRNSYISNRHQRYLGRKSARAASKNSHEFYHTLSFTVKFQHSLDICYLAYHYPFTYSTLLTNIWKMSKSFNPRTVHFSCDPLCDTLNGNQIPVITLTATDNVINRIEDRELIFLTSRVHPGESNASWLLDGILRFLTGNELSGAKLRCKYVIKIVPMLNVEGVINGCHRCSLSNEDLNRKWKSPHPILHPEIFHTKGLLAFSSRILKRPVYFYCDFHGHSLKKNIFLYGCSGQESYLHEDKGRVGNPVEYRMFSRLLEQCSLSFDPKSSHYKIQKSKEATARVTVWRELDIVRSYTMEATYCGFDRGTYKDTHINIGHLRDMGSSVCTALAALHDETQYMIGLIRNNNNMFEDVSRFKFKYMIEASNSSSNIAATARNQTYNDNSHDPRGCRDAGPHYERDWGAH
uniref:Cytosolic carboxypeptidase 1 n=1 Tax=Cacopsylla melanoneura TaxID=428564 RepID=A0A8D8R903_9HEMI